MARGKYRSLIRPARTFRPVLECLEDRLAPAVTPFLLPANLNPANYGPAITNSPSQQPVTSPTINSPTGPQTTSASSSSLTTSSPAATVSNANNTQPTLPVYLALFTGNLGGVSEVVPPPPQTVVAVGSTQALPVFVQPLYGPTVAAALSTANPPAALEPGVAAFSPVTFVAPENPLPRVVTAEAPGGSSATATLTETTSPENPAPSDEPANAQAPKAEAPPRGAVPGQQKDPRQGDEAPKGDKGAPAAKEPAPTPDRGSEPGTPARPKAPMQNPAPAVPPAPRREDKGPKDQGKPPAQEPPREPNSGVMRRLAPLIGAAAILGFMATYGPSVRWEHRRRMKGEGRT
jgi:hypothetical protein